ncbi:MAG: hypothetical protein HC942_12205 [Microcoleus sp. SU_5_6]|nr:hypothetical protein [Microcoleus sp. SU_5_6]NJL67900.1 hypothetical protein [Microcoleus sp. SM1_3_4]
MGCILTGQQWRKEALRSSQKIACIIGSIAVGLLQSSVAQVAIIHLGAIALNLV